MYRAKKITAAEKGQFYTELNKLLIQLIEHEKDGLANLCNAAALLGHQLVDINWAGFYLYKNNELVLGPFQGKPACTRIALGKGVCGTAAAKKETVLVPNVHEFPGHIACDLASQSEIVVPVLADGRLVAVLDIDSPILQRFGPEDAKGLADFAAILGRSIDWSWIK